MYFVTIAHTFNRPVDPLLGTMADAWGWAETQFEVWRNDLEGFGETPIMGDGALVRVQHEESGPAGRRWAGRIRLFTVRGLAAYLRRENFTTQAEALERQYSLDLPDAILREVA